MTERTSEASQAFWMRGLRRGGGLPLLLAVLLPLAGGLLLLPQAHLLAGILDRAIAGGEPIAAVLPAIGALTLVLLSRLLLAFLGESAAILGTERIKRDLRERLFGGFLAHRPDWTAARSSGVLSASIVDEVEALDGFYARFLPATIQAAILPIVFAVVILPLDWIVGLLFLLTAPMIPLFMALVGWGAEAAAKARTDAFLRLSGHFADRLSGLVTLALLGRGEREADACVSATEELRRCTLGVLRIAFLSSAVLEFFAALGVAGVALYVGLTYLGMIGPGNVELTLQAGLFLLLMAPEVYQPLRTMAAHYHDRANAKAAVSAIAQAFDTLPEVADGPAPHVTSVPSRRRAGAAVLDICGLTLTTPDGKRRVVERAHLHLEAGSRVALLGASGIGKSTLLEAISGLRAFEGTILLDEVPLDRVPEPHARIALLAQRPHLFCGTIADNIGFAREAASAIEIEAAAARACVLDFTRALPLGLHTPIGENGLGLSGGEAQRVALARIYLCDPSLILLDEPTAHLDAATAARVMDGLLDFAGGRTLLVATHSRAVAARLGRTLIIRDARLLPLPRKTRTERAA